MGIVEDAVTAILSGEPVVLPTDTVYGLVARPDHPEPAGRVARLKGRPETLPSSLMAASLDALFDCLPELRGRSGAIAEALLPGPYTLVLSNPARRYPWLTGSTPTTVGVRVPVLDGPSREILDRVAAVVATSANLHGGPNPRRLDEVPEEIRAGCAALVESGERPGVPSTVIDCTGEEPRVLREGAVPAAEAIERVLAAIA